MGGSGYLEDCWYVAAWDREVEAGKAIGRTVIEQPLAIVRGEDDKLTVYEDRCAHRHAPLSLGRIEGCNLRCMYHGLLFDRSGQCVEVPGAPEGAPKPSVRTYPVIERDSWIWVWMGDPAEADPDLCPAAWGIDNDEWLMRADQLDYDAHYMLINDNLCDLSHLDFVHEKTLGFATGGGWSDSVPRVRQLDRGIRVQRWHLRKPASPNNPKLVDTWSSYDFLVPGVFIMQNKSYLHDSVDTSGTDEPAEAPMTHRVEQQAVTPIDQNRTRYFFATGFSSAMPEKLAEPIFATVKAAFAEDREMIEAQQNVWHNTPENKEMAFIPHDKGMAMFRRTVDRLIAAQATGKG